MSHILHLLSPHLRVRMRLDQLLIRDSEKDTERSVPAEDIAAIICAAPDASFTSSALRLLAERNIPLLICNERFEPCSLTLPYYCATDTELLRRQVEWTPEWKDAIFRRIITVKVRHQAINLEGHGAKALHEIAKRCAEGSYRGEEMAGPGKSIAKVTLSRRFLMHADTPAACESRAARLYWRRVLPPLAQRLGTGEDTRQPGTRQGINGMLDYGYAIMRTAVLRALAARGFIAALGIHHTARAGTFALADDLMEPLRPFVDRALSSFISSTPDPLMQHWMKRAAEVLLETVPMKTGQLRLINALDLYVRSFAEVSLKRDPSLPLAIPPMAPNH